MFFLISLYLALFLFLAGLCYKVSFWFRASIGRASPSTIPSARIAAALKGIARTLFSAKIFSLSRTFVLDVLFLRRTLKTSGSRWAMHMLMFWGFMLLLLMHALDGILTAKLFPDYEPTLNPYLFLRNLGAAFLVAGIAIAAFRRITLKKKGFKTGTQDHYAMVILAVILVSGIFLEASKITSHARYRQMVEDYADLDSQQESRALESYWVDKFGVVSPKLKPPFNAAVMSKGRDLHEMNCAACHSRPQWAFMSYGVARVFRSAAPFWDRHGGSVFLLYIHFLACFVGLAYLPFSKMFHLIATPLSLLANSVMSAEKSDPANIMTKQVLELDACTHCGVCTQACTVRVCYEQIPNPNILPSEKIASLKRVISRSKLDTEELRSIREGLLLCTNCLHCTQVCPSGIDLQNLWFQVREVVLEDHGPEFLLLSPFSFFRGLNSDRLTHRQRKTPVELARNAVLNGRGLSGPPDRILTLSDKQRKFREQLGSSFQGKSFTYCFSCTSCTTSCPVVLNYAHPLKELDMVPHQIVRAAVLGIREIALSSRMLWSCLGCYQCQQACPQGVEVADLLYELKNMAIEQAENPETWKASEGKTI